MLPYGLTQGSMEPRRRASNPILEVREGVHYEVKSTLGLEKVMSIILSSALFNTGSHECFLRGSMKLYQLSKQGCSIEHFTKLFCPNNLALENMKIFLILDVRATAYSTIYLLMAINQSLVVFWFFVFLFASCHSLEAMTPHFTVFHFKVPIFYNS